MPELPEVETIVRDLNDINLAGQKICDIKIYRPKTLSAMSAEHFSETICHQTILKISRRAKFIDIALSCGLHLLIHLRMTGHLFLQKPPYEKERHDHIILHLEDGRMLVFEDSRGFGRFYLTPHPEAILGKLGPEPLGAGFTADIFFKMLQGKSRAIKPLLLDQTFIAGMGNIYADEVLWEALLHPQTKASDISSKQALALYRAIVSMLRMGIENRGTSLRARKEITAHFGNAKAPAIDRS